MISPWLSSRGDTETPRESQWASMYAFVPVTTQTFLGSTGSWVAADSIIDKEEAFTHQLSSWP